MQTVVGLSNISNGAPKHVRPIINRNFLAMLIYEGLTAAIIDPLDKDMMDTVKTTEMIMGKNHVCAFVSGDVDKAGLLAQAIICVVKMHSTTLVV